MPTINELGQRIWDLLTAPTPPQRDAYLDKLENKQPVFERPGEKVIVSFSDFNINHKARVEYHFGEMQNITGTNNDFFTGVEQALDYWESMKGMENPDLMNYALEVFLLENAKRLKVQIPSIIVQDPELMVSSEHVPAATRLTFATGPDEPKLDWYREDPLLNAHHRHWHQVYRNNTRDRHGEMFIYMHQQMIARYNAERSALNLSPVTPFNDMHDPVVIGYIAGPDSRLRIQNRQPNSFVQPFDADQLLQERGNLEDSIDNGDFNMSAAAADKLKAETDAASRFGWLLESNYHNWGHGVIASINNGVMGATVFAIRDVVFWEWHKGIDDLGYRWQERLQSYNFATEPAPVDLRKSTDAQNKPFTPDLILSFLKDIPGIDSPNFDGEALGTAAFGGANWDQEFADGTVNFNFQGQQTIAFTNTLETSMKTGTIRYRLQNGTLRTYDYPYLDHEPFGYFIRLENTTLVQKQVTVRVFMVPEGQEEDRRMWIELDKFLQELPPQSQTVSFRKDTESSVIRKPAVKNPATYNTNFDPVDIGSNNPLCDCGWPYHLFIPRGTSLGMPFRIMLMVTDAKVDLVGPEPDCGSLSFCGAQSNLYPDKRSLGYPFNRRFSGNGKAISKAIATNANMASRNISIKHV